MGKPPTPNPIPPSPPVPQNWVYNGFLQAPLTFRVTSILSSQVVTSRTGCLPTNWVPGTYYCSMQFTSPSSSTPPVALARSQSFPPPSPLPLPKHGWWWKVWHHHGAWWAFLRNKYRNTPPPPPSSTATHHRARMAVV